MCPQAHFELPSNALHNASAMQNDRLKAMNIDMNRLADRSESIKGAQRRHMDMDCVSEHQLRRLCHGLQVEMARRQVAKGW